MSLIGEHLAANKQELSDVVLTSTASDLNNHLDEMIMLKGQIHTWEFLEDLESFLELEEEIIDDQVQTVNVQGNSKDS